MEILYQEMHKIERIEARKRLVRTYQETGSVRRTAKVWETPRSVVRKWVRRHEKVGEEGLKDYSRAPTWPRIGLSFKSDLKSKLEPQGILLSLTG